MPKAQMRFGFSHLHFSRHALKERHQISLALWGGKKNVDVSRGGLGSVNLEQAGVSSWPQRREGCRIQDVPFFF